MPSMFPARPSKGLITPRVEAFIQELLTEAPSPRNEDIGTWINMCSTSPVLGPALDTIMLMGVSMLGEYTQENEQIQDYIRSQFEQMNGSLALVLAELLSMKPFGFAVSEWGVQAGPDGWELEGIQIIDPRTFTIQGRRGAIESIKYYGALGDRVIPYWKVIHVINQRHLTFGDPYGIGECKRAKAAWEAWKIVVSAMLIAAKRNATPITVGYSPSEILVPLLDANGDVMKDSNGDPYQVPAPRAMLDQLQNLENNSVISTDLQNKIETLNQDTGGAFFFQALPYLQQLQLMSFLMPESILTATGVGDSNLNTGHRSTMEQSIESCVDQIKEKILDGPIRALITWQFGEQDNWGDFTKPEANEADRVALLGAINQAVATGWFSAADLEVLNRGRKLAGLPPTSEIIQPIAPALSTNAAYWQ